MRKNSWLLVIVILMSVFIVQDASATNGMELEGYGPVATGMGGASFAYDNGVAAVMNNPATLGLMPDGNRLDVALGYLGPKITAKAPGAPDARSSADGFLMPAIGWAGKESGMTYGLGIFSEGGMGTEYDANSFLALGSGDSVRSEIGIGRLIIPFTHEVLPNLIIGGSLDYVWASLDLKMAATGAQLAGMVLPGTSGCSGGGCSAFPMLAGADWTRIDFSSNSAMSGAASGSGIAGKVGATLVAAKMLTIGAVYQSKTGLSDLKTGNNAAFLSASGFGLVGAGQMIVRDFEWPEMYGVGVALTPSNRLMLALDVKRINWSDTMRSFKMTYEGSVAGTTTTVNFEMPQHWKNQTVFALGAAFKVATPLIVRVGVNLSRNPVPDTYMNPLFPAIVKNHYTLGIGYLMVKENSIDLSFSMAPRSRPRTVPA